MNKPLEPHLLQSAEAFTDYLKNTALRLDESAEAAAQRSGARVGISRPHESAHLHVAGEAAYIDDLPELTGTLALRARACRRWRMAALTGMPPGRASAPCPAWWRC